MDLDTLTGRPVITATATDEQGNTSEFSGPMRKPDLQVTLMDVDVDDIVRRGSKFFLPYVASASNIGTGPAEEAVVLITGNGELVTEEPHIVTLAASQSQQLDGEWEVTDLLPKGSLGAPVSLQLVVEADPEDAIDEMPIGVNKVQSEPFDADPRPVFEMMQSEFKPEAFYLTGVSLPNKIDLTIDWNGNLNDGQIGADEQPTLTVFVDGGPPVVSQSVSDPLAEKQTVEINLGTHLSPGANQVQIRASTDLHFFDSEFEVVRFDQGESVPWIIPAGWTASSEGAGPYDKIAVYKAGFFFPQLATQGVFGIPVDRAGFAGGAFGPTIPQAALKAELKSDKSSRFQGELKLEAEVAGKDVGASDFGGIGGSVSGQLTGSFKVENNQLELDKLTAAIALEGNLTTPAIPFPPPASFLSAQGKIALGVDATVTIIEQEDGQLQWAGDLILGLQPSAEVIFAASAGIASTEVGFGADFRGEYDLDDDPCFDRSATIDGTLRLSASFLVFTAQKTFRFPFAATGCGGGEGEVLVHQPEVSAELGLVPRFAGLLLNEEGEGAGVGLPVITYPFAAPALARNDDGTMTLVYVEEDPTKPDGQHLELFASRWDGNSWSVPEQLTDDTLIDDAPSVAYDADGNAVAMWSRLKNSLVDPANVDPATVLGDLEVVYAVWDPNTETWSSATPLTDNSEMDFMPQLQADASGNVMAMWLRDSGNDPPIFPDDTTPLGADYIYAVWDGASWSTPDVAVSGVSTNEAPQFTLGDGDGVVVWSNDSDGDATTRADREIQSATWDGDSWSASSVLAGSGDDIADILPRIAYDSTGRANITWTKSGVPLSEEPEDVTDQLFFVEFDGGTFSAPSLAVETNAINEPEMIVDDRGNPIVVWQSLSPSGPDIFYAVLDRPSDQWSKPIQFTDDADFEWGFNPFINDAAELEILHLNREVGSEPAPNGSGEAEGEPGDPIMIPTFETSSLATTVQSLGADLTIDSISLADPNPAPGSTVQVRVDVSNRGDVMSPSSELALFDDGDPVGTNQAVAELLAGQSAQFTFDWIVPQNAAAPHTLTARIDPDDTVAETDETNNEASLVALQPALIAGNVVTETTEDTITVTADITNQGATPTAGSFEVALKQDDPNNGDVLATTTISSALAVGQSTSVMFAIDDPLAALGGFHVGFVAADSKAEINEIDETNNAGFGALNPFLSWQNPLNRFDVLNDDQVIALDVLVMINELNSNGARLLPVPPTPSFFFDVNGDGSLTPNDVLQVINAINLVDVPEGSGEGESQAEWPLWSEPVLVDAALVPRPAIGRSSVPASNAAGATSPPSRERPQPLNEITTDETVWYTAPTRDTTSEFFNRLGSSADDLADSTWRHDDLAQLLDRVVSESPGILSAPTCSD